MTMPDPETLLPHWINRLSFQLRARAQEALAPFDLSPEEWGLLLVLWSAGPLPMNALAQRTVKDRTTVTRLVDRLVAKGVVARQAQDGDRRVVEIAVTPEGQARRDKVVAAMMPVVAAATTGIALHELEQARSVLMRMAANLG
ncbi:MAG: MarR family transcriptional regulator [Pseudooceanicola sp.]|nr:MarR family transcriptional regulator [Pseudooceanicola sp.]